MKYPEKWTVKHEMTIRLKIAAVTHAPRFSFKKSIYRAPAYILRMFSEAFLTKNAWPGNISMASAKKSNFFSLFMVVHTNISYISLNFTHKYYILFFILHCREYKRCIFEKTQISQKNLQLQLADNQYIWVLNVELITKTILRFVNNEKMISDKYLCVTSAL